MSIFKKSRHKPLYKKFLNSRKNVQNKKKIVEFKKKKWIRFVKYLTNYLSWNKRKPFTIYDFHVPKFSSLGNSFKKRFRNELQDKKRFNLFYIGLKKKFIKKKVNLIFRKKLKNVNSSLLELFESRLDSILYRACFCSSIRNAQQLISHGCIKINKQVIRKKSFILKQGDLIEINPSYSHLVKLNIKKNKKSRTIFWPIPPDYLIIKYRTLQIVVGDIRFFNFSNYFSFWLNTNSILDNYKL